MSRAILSLCLCGAPALVSCEPCSLEGRQALYIHLCFPNFDQAVAANRLPYGLTTSRDTPEPVPLQYAACGWEPVARDPSGFDAFLPALDLDPPEGNLYCLRCETSVPSGEWPVTLYYDDVSVAAVTVDARLLEMCEFPEPTYIGFYVNNIQMEP